MHIILYSNGNKNWLILSILYMFYLNWDSVVLLILGRKVMELASAIYLKNKYKLYRYSQEAKLPFLILLQQNIGEYVEQMIDKKG